MSYVGDLVERLKRPAVEAYIKSLPGYWDYGTARGEDFSGVEHTATGYLVERGGSYLVITPPNEAGYGGGRLAVWQYATGGLYKTRSEVASWADPDEFIEAFNEVRSRIDRAFSAWLDLPQGLRFDTQVQSAASAIKLLQLDIGEVESWMKGGPYPEYQMGSTLIDELATVGRILSDDLLFGGLALDAFKDRYGGNAQRAAAGLYAMSTVCGGHIAAERALWKNARQDLLGIIETGESGLIAASTTHHDINWGLVLSVVGVAIKGASLIAKATGAGAAASLALDGVGLIVDEVGDQVADADKSKVVPPSYSEVMAAIETSLNELNAAIRNEESLIASNTEANLGHIRDDASKYDLTGVIFDDNDDRGTKIRFDTVTAPSISVAMRNASAQLEAASSYFSYFDITSACQRDPSIGLGEHGPAAQVDEFSRTIKQLLNALSVECERGADNWDRATQLFEQHESGVVELVNVLESEIDLASLAQIDADSSVVDPLMSSTKP